MVAMRMDGGAGDDAFQTTFGHVDINAPMTLNQMGGAGRDDIRVICGFNPQPDPPAFPLVSVNATVNMMLDGGWGDDNIAVICGFNPQPDPPSFPEFIVLSSFQLNVLGGQVNDSLAGVLQPAVQRDVIHRDIRRPSWRCLRGVGDVPPGRHRQPGRWLLRGARGNGVIGVVDRHGSRRWAGPSPSMAAKGRPHDLPGRGRTNRRKTQFSRWTAGPAKIHLSAKRSIAIEHANLCDG